MYSRKNAQKDAIRVLLFSGIQSTSGCPVLPPILRNEKEKEAFNGIAGQFFSEEGAWFDYTRNSRKEEGKRNHYSVSVNINELKKYLEQKKIIQSINSIF